MSEPPEEGEEQQGLRTQQLALKQLQKCDITSGSPAGLEAARGRKSQVFSSLSRVEARLGLHRVVLTSPGMSVQLLLTPHPPRNVSVPHRCVPFPSTPPCLSPWDLPAGGRQSQVCPQPQPLLYPRHTSLLSCTAPSLGSRAEQSRTQTLGPGLATSVHILLLHELPVTLSHSGIFSVPQLSYL